MLLSEIRDLLHADVLTGEDMLEEEAFSACGSDMMSDVLAFVHDQAVLLTGLVNSQVIRTAMMMDIHCVVFLRGKRPSPDMVELACENRIALMAASDGLFEACGKLYCAGLGREG